jgi:hypothetical protein
LGVLHGLDTHQAIQRLGELPDHVIAEFGFGG